tara:strand:+ start:217 stop:534 length:318 start_codon:yes stop_codon:yes gene_type:complete
MDPESAELALDAGDPIVVFASMALGEALKKFLAEAAYAKLKPIIPIIIVLLAFGGRVVYDSVMLEGLTMGTGLRALAAGSVAVLTHTQFRSLAKVFFEKPVTPEE